MTQSSLLAFGQCHSCLFYNGRQFSQPRCFWILCNYSVAVWLGGFASSLAKTRLSLCGSSVKLSNGYMVVNLYTLRVLCVFEIFPDKTVNEKELKISH